MGNSTGTSAACRNSSSSGVRDRRRAQVLILCVLAFVVVVAVAALAVDTGHLFATEAQLQNAADAAAKAALLEFWEERATGASESDARTAAREEKTVITELNRQNAGSSVQFGTWDGSGFTSCDSSTAANAIRVRVFHTGDAPGGSVQTFFAGILGLNSVDVSADATAHFVHGGLLPFALYRGELTAAVSSVTLYNDTEVTAGAFGLIDYNGGSNSSDDTKQWARYGYDGPFYIDPSQGSLTVDGSTGLTSSISTGINYHITEGHEIVTPIYDTVSGTAQSTQFEIIGYVKMVITDLTWQEDAVGEEIKSISGTVTGKYIVDSGHTEGSMRDFMQLQLVQ